MAKAIKMHAKKGNVQPSLSLSQLPITLDWLHIAPGPSIPTYINYTLNICTKWAYTCHNNNNDNIQNQNIHPKFFGNQKNGAHSNVSIHKN